MKFRKRKSELIEKSTTMVKEEIKVMETFEDPINLTGFSRSTSGSVSRNRHRDCPIEIGSDASLYLLSSTTENLSKPTQDSIASVSDFLRSFRENGAHFISSAYL